MLIYKKQGCVFPIVFGTIPGLPVVLASTIVYSLLCFPCSFAKCLQNLFCDDDSDDDGLSKSIKRFFWPTVHPFLKCMVPVDDEDEELMLSIERPVASRNRSVTPTTGQLVKTISQVQFDRDNSSGNTQVYTGKDDSFTQGIVSGTSLSYNASVSSPKFRGLSSETPKFSNLLKKPLIERNDINNVKEVCEVEDYDDSIN